MKIRQLYSADCCRIWRFDRPTCMACFRIGKSRKQGMWDLHIRTQKLAGKSVPETIKQPLESGSETMMLSILLLWTTSLKYCSKLKGEYTNFKSGSVWHITPRVSVWKQFSWHCPFKLNKNLMEFFYDFVLDHHIDQSLLNTKTTFGHVTVLLGILYIVYVLLWIMLSNNIFKIFYFKLANSWAVL